MSKRASFTHRAGEAVYGSFAPVEPTESAEPMAASAADSLDAVQEQLDHPMDTALPHEADTDAAEASPGAGLEAHPEVSASASAFAPAEVASLPFFRALDWSTVEPLGVTSPSLFQSFTKGEHKDSTWPRPATRSCSFFRCECIDLLRLSLGVLWSPDGTCLLAADDLTNLHLFEIPPSYYHTSGSGSSSSSGIGSGSGQPCSPVLSMKEGETIYDYTWYPHMRSSEPQSCVFASTARDHPIHLWDAYTGSLRASYLGFDHLDEVVPAFSLAFSPGGDQILAGYNRCVRLFDLAVPGRPSSVRPTAPTRKSDHGQHGLISALDTAPDGSGLYAAGSYRGTIVLYDLRSGSARLEMQTDMVDDGMSLRSSQSAIGGITQLKFTWDGRLLSQSS